MVGIESMFVYDQGDNGIVLSTNGSFMAFSGIATNFNKGAVWVFKRDESDNEYIQVGSRLFHQDAFKLGQRLAMSADGTIVVATAAYDDTLPSLIAFAVFKYNSAENAYETIQAQLTNTSPFIGYPFAVALTGSGDTLLFGESDYQRHFLPQGKIILFVRKSNGTYAPTGHEFTGAEQLSSIPLNLHFGYSIGVSADGKRLVSSAPGDDISRGAVYFFDLNTATSSPTKTPSTTSSAAYCYSCGLSRLMLSCTILAACIAC